MTDRGGIQGECVKQLADGSWVALESGNLDIAAHTLSGGKGATLGGPDDCYRYNLWRRWNDGPLLGFLMLNPSTADALLDDHTITRCCYYADREGYAGIAVRNLFAWRATDPRDLRRVYTDQLDIVGPDNDRWLTEFLADQFSVRQIVAAWGAVHRWHWPRVDFVLRLAADLHRPLYALGTTQRGWPRHPSRLSNDAELTRLFVSPP